MCKTWKYFEKGHAIACDNCTQYTARVDPDNKHYLQYFCKHRITIAALCP